MNSLHHLDRSLYSNPNNTFLIHLAIRRRQDVFTGESRDNAYKSIAKYISNKGVVCYRFVVFPSRITMIVSPNKKNDVFSIADGIIKAVSRDVLKDTGAQFFGDFLDHLFRATESVAEKIADLSGAEAIERKNA